MNSIAVESTSGSSDGEDDESGSSDTGSTATCGPVQNVDEPLSFNGIGTINMDNCQDSHIGPRIIADNLNIILSNPKDFQYIYGSRDLEKEVWCNAKIKNTYTGENYDNPSFSWNFKRAPWSYIPKIGPKKLFLVLFVILILVGIAVFFGLLFGRKSQGTDRENTTGSITSQAPVTIPVTSQAPVTIPVTSPVTFPISPVTEPTDVGSTVPSTSAPSYGKLIDRSAWNGKMPQSPQRSLQMAWHVALDNLQGDRCSSVDICSIILQQREKADNVSLNYNFLIDDSGNVYEARGWDYESDDANSSTTIKVAFIGNYSDGHLTQAQISSFLTYIQKDSTHVLTVAGLEAQCCRDLPKEMGPDKNVICDMATTGFIKANRCSNCRWPRDQLNCVTKN